MRPSAELDEVREQLQEAAGALGRELAQLRAPDTHLELAAAGDQLEDAGEEYVRLSEELAAAIDGSSEDQDAEAVRRLACLIGLDLEVAERLVLMSDFEAQAAGGPESFLEGMPDDSVSEELARLDDLGSVAAAALTPSPSVRRGILEAGLEGLAGTDIAAPVEAILDDAGKTVTSTVQEVGWTQVADDFVALAGKLAGDGAREQVTKVVSAARDLWKRTSRLAAKVLGSVLEKIIRFLGAERLATMLDAMRDKVVDWWANVPGEGVAAKSLAVVMRSDDVVRSCRDRLDGKSPEVVAAAVEACDELAELHHDGLVWVRRGNKALGWAGSVKAFLNITGVATLVALVGLALIAYTSWLAHDYLDSPIFAGQILGRVRGVDQTVAALAGA